jgi:hypothetical protein
MRIIPSSLFEVVPDNNYSDEVLDAFKSELIQVYENAIQQGITPRDAIAMILTWVAAENCRLDPSSSRPYRQN